MTTIRQALVFTFTALAQIVFGQNLPLNVEGGSIRKGASNTVRYVRPDSLTSVRLYVPSGTVKTWFKTSYTVKDGQHSSSADSVFSWTICDYPESRIWAVAEGFIGERSALRDTTWFNIVPDSIAPKLIGPDEGRGTDGPWMADEWVGVAPPTKSFFSKETAHEVLQYEVEITQKGKVVEQFKVTGPMLTPAQRSTIRKYTYGEVIIRNFRFRHECGVELPGPYLFRLRYAAPR